MITPKKNKADKEKNDAKKAKKMPAVSFATIGKCKFEMRGTPPRYVVTEVLIGYLLEEVESGRSLIQIAKDFKVSQSTLWAWLNGDENTAGQYARARLDGGQSWLDKGIEPLQESLSKSSDIDPSAAKAYEQACRFRAGMLNPKLREKHNVELTGEGGGAIRTTINIAGVLPITNNAKND